MVCISPPHINSEDATNRALTNQFLTVEEYTRGHQGFSVCCWIYSSHVLAPSPLSVLVCGVSHRLAALSLSMH